MTMHWAIAHTIEENVESSLQSHSSLIRYIWNDIYPTFWGSILEQKTKTHVFEEIVREVLLHTITWIITPQLEDSLIDLQDILPSNAGEDWAKELWLKIQEKTIELTTWSFTVDKQAIILDILDYNSDIGIMKQNRLVIAFIEWCNDDMPITSNTQALCDKIILRVTHSMMEQRKNEFPK